MKHYHRQIAPKTDGCYIIYMKDPRQWLRDNVSRETLSRLEIYAELLLKWQEKINLVANSTLDDLWNRHFIDSLQIVSKLPQNVSRETFCLADLGSGGGFPGLVLAAAGIPNINLIESDQRKCAFLREVARQMGENVSRETFSDVPDHLGVKIHNQRIESVNLKADIITSRAFADLNKTLEISEHLCHPETQYLLLKPQDIDKELTETTRYWYFQSEMSPSVSDPRGGILRIWDIKRK